MKIFVKKFFRVEDFGYNYLLILKLKTKKMKDLLLLMALTIMANVSAQTYSKPEISKIPIKTSTYLNADVMSADVTMSQYKIATIPFGNDVLVTEYLGSGSWLIKKDTLIGYVFTPDLVINNEMNSLISKWQINNPQYIAKNVFEAYTNKFGQPTSKSSFKDGNFNSQTYVWNCANGKYHSVTFDENEYGTWAVKTEYESECIQ
jgi:hypothetical protein